MIGGRNESPSSDIPRLTATPKPVEAITPTANEPKALKNPADPLVEKQNLKKKKEIAQNGTSEKLEVVKHEDHAANFNPSRVKTGLLIGLLKRISPNLAV